MGINESKETLANVDLNGEDALFNLYHSEELVLFSFPFPFFFFFFFFN